MNTLTLLAKETLFGLQGANLPVFKNVFFFTELRAKGIRLISIVTNPHSSSGSQPATLPRWMGYVV